MKIQAFGQTDVGRVREGNEDTFLIDPLIGVYLVSDGMGGHAGGEVASAMVAEAIGDFFRQRQPALQKLHDPERVKDAIPLMVAAVQAANQRVYQVAQQTPELRGMGATLTMLLVIGQKAVMAHVGDSRLYLLRDQWLHQLSVDHTLANELYRGGMLTAEEAAQNPNAGVLLRAMGNHPSVQVDTLLFDLFAGDTCLICSDGLTNYVNDAEELRSHLASSELEEVPEQLVELANSRGGSDNITVVVARASSEGDTLELELERTGEVRRQLVALGRTPFFTDLSLRQLVRVQNRADIRLWSPNQAILTAGQPNDTFVLILEGEMEVTRAGESARLGPGAWFGANSLVSPRPFGADVRTLTDTQVLAITSEDFLELMRRRPHLGLRIMRSLGRALGDRLDQHQILDVGVSS